VTLPPWEERPVELANLLNPAFCALLLQDAAHDYPQIGESTEWKVPDFAVPHVADINIIWRACLCCHATPHVGVYGPGLGSETSLPAHPQPADAGSALAAPAPRLTFPREQSGDRPL